MISGAVVSGSSVVNEASAGTRALPALSSIPSPAMTVYSVSYSRSASGVKVADLRLPATETVPETGPPPSTPSVPAVTVPAATAFEKVTVIEPPTGTSTSSSCGENPTTSGAEHSMGISTSTTLSIGYSVSATGWSSENVIVAVNTWPTGVSVSILRSQSPRFSADAPGARSGYGALMLYSKRTKGSDSEKAPERPVSTMPPSLRAVT